MYNSIVKPLCYLVVINLVFASEIHPDNDLSNVVDEECNGISQFQCLNGECVMKESRCNGIADCLDSSDELECCSQNQFSCGPYHCIDKSKVCDGINDCTNNKDELQCQCMLPNVLPKNTDVFLYNSETKVRPGTLIDVHDFIEYKCTDGYIEISESWQTNSCQRGKNGSAEWQHNSFQGCSKTCSKAIFGDHKIFNQRTIGVCHNENSKRFNCRTEPHIFPGSTAQIQCLGQNVSATTIECNENGEWSGLLAECNYTEIETLNSGHSDVLKCSTELLTKPSLQVIFIDSLGTVTNEGTVYAGTKIKIVCAQEYYSYDDGVTDLTCNTNGKWTGGVIPTCKMVCGERSGRYMIPSMTNGIKTSTLIYPWVAAIYRKSSLNYNYICGGSVISAKLVISAAHCFTEKTNYLVGVGKQMRQFIEQGAQIHEIREIKHLSAYIGQQDYYENDIIVIVVKEFIRFDVHIKPVCIDYETQPNQIKENVFDLDHGYIAGWDSLETNKSSGLVFTSHPIVDNCRSYLHDNGRFNELNYLTRDKFCAGNFDSSSVCSGDSGHGLVFEKLVDNRSRFFLYGILSLTGEKCNEPSYGFYTNVQSFKDQIKNLMDEYKD